jgi:hypothetical protein
MCTGVELLMIASAVASAASAAQAHQAQKAQADYQNKANAIAEKQIGVEADMQRMDAERQREQERQQATSEANAYQLDATRERSHLDTLIGEQGGGNTGNRQLTALGVRQGQDYATMASNASNKQAELGFQESATLNSTRSKVTQLRPGVGPSGSSLALSLASTALTTAGRYQSINNPKPNAGTK